MPEIITAAEDVEAAEHEAQQAQRTFLDLEHAALHEPAGSRPSAEEVLAQRQEAELAARRVEVTRQRADEARVARRLAACKQLAGDIDAAAAAASEPSRAMARSLAAVARAAGTFLAECQAHDETVAALHARATGLGGDRGTRGPLASNAFVAHNSDGAVRHRDLELGPIGAAAREAVVLAAGGDVPAALERVCCVRDRGPQRPDLYYLDTVTSGVVTATGAPYPALAAGIRTGRFRKMSQEEIDAHHEAGGRA